MQLTFLVTSPRVAPGLLSWPAWQAIASADRVLASSERSPLARAVSAAGHLVDVLPDASAIDLLALPGAGSQHDEQAYRVVWLASDEEAEHLPPALAAAIVDGSGPEVEVLHGSYDVPGARLLDLVTVMDRLRVSCPWDREQTHESLARYLLEEAYETLEAIDTGDRTHLREELGDLLLQVFFHARIAAENAPDPEAFTIDDVAAGIVDKLVHRHPHVFAGLEVSGADEVEANWESLKATEKQRTSVLEGIPQAMPALALADKVLGRATSAGLAPDASEPAAGTSGSESDTERQLGNRLLALVIEARAAEVDPEQALRAAVRRLAASVREHEQGLPDS